METNTVLNMRKRQFKFRGHFFVEKMPGIFDTHRAYLYVRGTEKTTQNMSSEIDIRMFKI